MDFKSALHKLMQDFNKDIIFDKRVISILDDYGAFKDVPYYKLFYKTILSSGDLKKLVGGNENCRNKELFSFISMTGLDENKVRAFLSIVFECHTSESLIPGNSNSQTYNTQTYKEPEIRQQQRETSIHTNSNASFLGIKLGININDFYKELKLNRYRNNFSVRGEIGLIHDDIRSRMIDMNLHDLAFSDDVKIENVRICRFPFAGFNGHKGYNYYEGSEVAIFYTPYTHIVYKVMVYLIPSEYMFDEEICEKVRVMLFDRYGKPTKDDISGLGVFDTPNDKSCNYILHDDFEIKYSIWQRGAKSGVGSFKHYLTYSSTSLCKKAELEIDHKIKEIILKNEAKKKNQYAKDIQDI